MPTLLVVHHTVSPPLHELLEAALDGARDAARQLGGDLSVVTRPALTAGPVDVLAADAIVLGTPANIGYMSGALKHFFDVVYYPCLVDTVGTPVGVYVHGNNDTVGAARAISKITGALQWQQVAPAVEITGPVDRAAREQVADVAALAAAAALGN